jgi:hypothetical protein
MALAHQREIDARRFRQARRFGAGLDRRHHYHLVAGLSHLAGADFADMHSTLAQHGLKTGARRGASSSRPPHMMASVALCGRRRCRPTPEHRRNRRFSRDGVWRSPCAVPGAMVEKSMWMAPGARPGRSSAARPATSALPVTLVQTNLAAGGHLAYRVAASRTQRHGKVGAGGTATPDIQGVPRLDKVFDHGLPPSCRSR